MLFLAGRLPAHPARKQRRAEALKAAQREHSSGIGKVLGRAIVLVLGLALSASAAAQSHLLTLAMNGAWTWFNDPRALFHNGALYFGCVRSDGASTLNVLDMRNGTTRSLWTSTWSQYDDHDNAGLLSLQDGRLLAIYARHGSTTTFSYRLSLTADPTTPAAWGAEQTLPPTGTGLTYSNPYQLAAEAGKVYDFCRDLNFNPTVLTSTDAGTTWSTPQLFIKTGTGSTRPYVKYCSDYSSRIDFLYTDGHPRDLNNSLYHTYYANGALYQTDGTFLKSFGALPLLHDSGERGTVIYQYSAADTSDPNDHIPTGRAWCWEIAYQTNGSPACVFSVQRDSVMGSSWADDRIYYYYARWTGTNWQKRFIAQAGRPLYTSEDDYAGGIALDPEDPSVVYVSTDAAAPFDLTTISNVPLAAHFELYQGVTADGGLSFTWTALTTNSTVDNFRPYVPRNRRGVPALIWFRGSYPTFTSFTTSVVGLFTNEFPRAGLLAYWPLDTANRGATPDLGLGNYLVINGAPSIVPGVVSNAFSFDGSSQYLSVAHSPSGTNGLPAYQPGGACTIAGWVRGPRQTAKYIFAEGSTTNNNPLFVLQTGQAAAFNDRLDLILRSTSGATLANHIVSTRPVFDGAWHHFACVDNAGAVQMYIDGQADTNFAYTPTGTFALNTTSVGALVRSNASGYFGGAIDDVMVWARALSQAEVQSVMTNSLPVPAPTPPAIAQQSSGATVAMGDYLAFSAQVLGDPPLGYQWSENGSALADATGPSLVVPTSESGSNYFTLTVTNAGGSVTGAPIPLVVLPDPPPDVSAGLVSSWPLDAVTNDSGNLTSPDLYSRNDLLLQFMEPTNLVPGQFGKALVFNGDRQYCERTGGYPIYLATNYTVSLWVNGAPGQFNRQVFAEGGAGGDFFLLGTENSTPAGGSLNVKVNPGMADRKTSRTVFDNTWHHVVWADENGKGKLYVDGELDETDFSYSRARLALDSTALAALVRSGPANYFAGTIDAVAVWNRRLTLTEIRQVATNGIPPIAAPIPPAIFAQPTDQTNGIFAGDPVTLSVLASGTGPLHYQWRKDGADVSPLNNPGAVSNVLSFASVQTGDAGAYCVVITNVAGAVTSSIVQLAVTGFTPATNGPALELDIDLTGEPNTQPGFQVLTLGANGALFSNEVQVTLSPIGAVTLAERLRSTAPLVTDNPPALSQARLYNDFAFASSTSDGTGLSILVSRLAPNTPYGLTIWSFDPQSLGTRVSDWTETASGTPVPIVTGYTFDGNNLPAADYDYSFGALLTSSPTGQLRIEGVRHGGTSYGVFVNALQLVANPAIRITAARVAGNGSLQFTLQTQFPGQSVAFQESPDLTPGSWRPAVGAVVTQIHGAVMIVEFPRKSPALFYRAVRQ